MSLLDDLANITIFDTISLLTLLWIAIIVVVAAILERIVTRYIRKFGKKTRLERDVTNRLILTFRLLILIGALASLTRVSGVPTDWFLAFSALGGAAVGFASTQTIGNFVAGLYLLTIRPFKVGDLIRLGTIEGVVQEITINYTKILTMGNNTVSIFNLSILQRDMTNFFYRCETREELYCYTFEIAFDHSVSATKTAEIFEQVFNEYVKKLRRKPSYVLLRSGAFERAYLVYVYVKQPEDVFTLRPRITEEVFKRWDEERSAK